MKKATIKICSIIALLLLTVSVSAQSTQKETLTVPLSNPNSPGTLVLKLIYGSIKVTGYDGKEVIVTAAVGQQRHRINHRTNQTKNGMKKITNNSMEFSVEESNNIVNIKTHHNHNSIISYDVKVPKDFSLKLRAVNSGNIFVENVNGELEVSNTNGKVTLLDIGGSLIADALNDDIKVTFTKVTENASMAFSNLNGDIDITFPKNLKANIKAKSDRGEIFTDFDMAVNPTKPKVTKNSTSNTYKVKLEQWVTGLINGGGPEMSFKTMNGDIMIRAK